MSSNHSTCKHFSEPDSGLAMVMQYSTQLKMLSGRSLDVGCGSGSVIEYLSRSEFDLAPFGVDRSAQKIQQAIDDLGFISGIRQRLSSFDGQTLLFDDDYFSLVTCHHALPLDDLDATEHLLSEMQRVLRKGGMLLLRVNCDPSPSSDQRLTTSIDRWLSLVEPTKIEFDTNRQELTLWKQNRQTQLLQPERRNSIAETTDESSDLVDGHPKDSAELYQRIYDENPWYGDADQGRSPGVRLLDEYQEWLLSPVIDLGCGRGQTVERLRKTGMEADGIDQVSINPEMRVGDITKPLDELNQYRSAVCIDCIEHLYPDQVLGLFENMKQVQRQAFSIHNGESTGTGQELHVNRQSFVDWTKLIREHFDIATAIQVHENQILYLTQTKKQDESPET